MALIKCTNCGEEISDKSFKCVHCGTKTEYSIIHICPECGKEYDNIICKNCGYRYKDNNIDISNEEVYSFNFWTLIISILIGIVILVFSMVKGCPFIIAFLFAVGSFGFSLAIFTGNLGELTDRLDDIQASTNKDPYKRALYKQTKRNNRK